MSHVSLIGSVVADIAAHIKANGGRYRDWYCGIAADPRDRLFGAHQVSVQGAWIYRNCGSDHAARRVEDHFHNLGCQGAGGGGGRDTVYVYAYKITPFTREDV
jgi:hypothetical protein